MLIKNTKAFLISVDTEGDNLWEWDKRNPINTHNSQYIPRFQKLCDKYGFKPTYLVNYEMINDKSFVIFLNNVLARNGCEVGMHLHAWNTPPIKQLDKRCDGIEEGLPYITEYETNDIDDKVNHLTGLIKNNIGVLPVTHRAGRWATNEVYAKILEKYGYKYDCSFTPGLSWDNNPGFTNGSRGTDYSSYDNSVRDFYGTKMIEIPLPSYSNKRIKKENIHGLKSFLKNIIYARKRKQMVQLRPNGHNLNDLLYIVKKNRKSNEDYLMFMLHSSEFMPGGSPNFKTVEDIENLYSDLEIIFGKINKHYIGMTIGEYGERISRGNK